MSGGRRNIAVSYDDMNDVLTVEGMRFAGDFFRTLSPAGPPVGTLIRIERREDGVVLLTKVEARP